MAILFFNGYKEDNDNKFDRFLSLLNLGFTFWGPTDIIS